MPNTKDATRQRNSAVAIKRGADSGARPHILAKGQGAVAEQILEIAFATGVKVRTDADLIEVLQAVEVDCEIPPIALATVAEILSYLYRANSNLMQPLNTKLTDEAPDD